MAHLEMSLSEPAVDDAAPEQGTLVRTSVDRWSDAVDGAHEACLVIDAHAVISAASPAACGLLGFTGPGAAIGECLYDGVLPLVDFTATARPIPVDEVGRIPPLQPLTSRRLARGLIRLRIDGEVVTVDAVSTPLWERDQVIGTLTFLCQV
jgi:PAS domain-containing protein